MTFKETNTSRFYHYLTNSIYLLCTLLFGTIHFSLTTMMLLFLVFIPSTVQTITTTCPSQCVCNEEKHYAKCTNLLVIPVLPSYVTSLDFSGNFIYHLKRSTLATLKSLKLENLSLANDNILHASSDSLNNLLYLRSLDLSQNPLNLSVAVTAIMSIRSAHCFL
ncbi:unnamed protein product [Mytilus edulis]|uniref:Uncharacterized protein n=1 Tax=Mytilus edulis TaxID=6550 RepID=A0A8S3S575_MYTED|nr:unnamed protein product [Mytilus edulis]